MYKKRKGKEMELGKKKKHWLREIREGERKKEKEIGKGKGERNGKWEKEWMEERKENGKKKFFFGNKKGKGREME